MKATIISIGDELLAGVTVNTNASYMGKKLGEYNIEVYQILTISDSSEAIISALDNALKHSDLCFVTGGLGPTHDDITKAVLVEYFEDSLEFHQATYAHISDYLHKRNRSPKESHKLQSYMPKKAEILKNLEGTAPGMIMEKSGKCVFAMPGVPREMRYLMSEEIIPFLLKKFDLKPKNQIIFKTAGVPESKLSGLIEEEIQSLPSDIKIAFLPSIGEVKVRLSSGSNDSTSFLDYKNRIDHKLRDYIYGYNSDSLKSRLGELLVEKGLKLATAESCTGGKLASEIVSVPGSSRYFIGGTIPYSYDLKEKWLGVKEESLNNYGAVSEEVVIEMLNGLLETSGADLGISISGIAGPGGGTPEKPVGTIWVAWGMKGNIHSKRLQLWNVRDKNISYTCSFCINVLINFLISCKFTDK